MKVRKILRFISSLSQFEMYTRDLTTPFQPKIKSTNLGFSLQNYVEVILGVFLMIYIAKKVKKFYLCVVKKSKNISEEERIINT